jgi:hypothetical protein
MAGMAADGVLKYTNNCILTRQSAFFKKKNSKKNSKKIQEKNSTVI